MSEETGSAPLRVGVVGIGLIAQAVHLPTLRQLDDRFTISALADPSGRVRRRVAERYGVPRQYAEHRELMASDVDAVLICGPNATHAGMVLDALDAGLDVFVEKPLCLAPSDADRIVDRQSATGRVVQVGYMKRFDRNYERLVESLARSGTGPSVVTTFTADPGLSTLFRPHGFVQADDLGDGAAARLEALTSAQVGDAVGTQAPDEVRSFSDAFMGALVHDVNAALGALPSVPVRVIDGWSGPRASMAGGLVTLAGGVRWSMTWLLTAPGGPFRQSLTFAGPSVTHTLSFPAPYSRGAPTELEIDRGETRTVLPGYGDSYALELEHFHDCITAGVPCRTPAAQARADVVLLTEVFRASLGAEGAR